MKTICTSAEHHLLTTLESLKTSTNDWMVIHFPLSKMYNHGHFIKDLENIPDLIKSAQMRSSELVNTLYSKTKTIESGYIYLFANCDVLLLANASDPKNRNIIQNVHTELSKTLKERCSDVGLIPRDLYQYQKIVDKKMLASQCFDAYNAMTDSNKIRSIPIRRSRRDRGLVLLVEDDHFTASHAANILVEDYDVVIARNGEEAIMDYIKHAPDIVCLDIHLPGISGIQTLEAIKKIDPHAYVVMVSVDTSTESIAAARRNGVQNFTKKPFSKSRLLNTTRKSPYVHARHMNFTLPTEL